MEVGPLRFTKAVDRKMTLAACELAGRAIAATPTEGRLAPGLWATHQSADLGDGVAVADRRHTHRPGSNILVLEVAAGITPGLSTGG